MSFAKRWLCSPNFFGTFNGMPKDWARLAKAVAQRRRELGLSQDAIRRAGGPSDVVIGRIESNDEPHPRDDTINKLDEPLRWEPGSARRVLAGEQPRAIDQVPDLKFVSTDALVTELRRRITEEDRINRQAPPL